MTRSTVLTDEMWARIEPELPPSKGPMGRPMTPHRLAVEGAIFPVADRDRVAGSAGGVRAVADGVATASSRWTAPDDSCNCRLVRAHPAQLPAEPGHGLRPGGLSRVRFCRGGRY
jgi:hypothetical protein